MSPAKEMSGKRFGLLTVVEFAKKNRNGPHWTCVCDCGVQKVIRGSHLRAGLIRSCGCLKRTEAHRSHLFVHGMSRTGGYQSWNNMMRRCNNPKDKRWKDYGGRGISVCPRWSSFSNFLCDMGEKPEGMVIDRIDNDGNYEPQNCRWVTPSENMRNRRNTIFITVGGETRSLTEWAEITGINHSTIRKRLTRSRWSVERALEIDWRKEKKK